MAKRTLYRIDQRTFGPGDEMTAPGDHMKNLSKKQQFAEFILRREAGKDRSSLRAVLIFAFDSLDWTKRYFVGKANRFVYELEVEETDIVHSADMFLFNDIADHGKDDEKSNELAARYWSGDKRDGKHVEHICTAAKVTKIVYTPDQKSAVRGELYGVKKPVDDDESFYKSIGKQFGG
jgi:hypothetical protein